MCSYGERIGTLCVVFSEQVIVRGFCALAAVNAPAGS